MNAHTNKIKLISLSVIPFVLLMVLLNTNSTPSDYQPRKSEFALHSESEYSEEYTNGSNEYLERLRGNYTREQFLRVQATIQEMPVNRSSISWSEKGPDNFGGRARAVIVDKDDVNHVLAGSVSGGLFESFNRGNFWAPVEEFSENLSVSSICQTADGTFYIATGHLQETSTGSQNAYDTGANGFGIYTLDVTGAINHIPNSENFSWINEIVTHESSNEVWFATNQGLQNYNPITNQISSISNGLSPGSCNSLAMSKDGQIIVCAMAGGRTNVSTDGGATFLDVSNTSNSSNPIASGSSRIEYAISHERAENGNYYVYASAANSLLTGIWMSEDNGMNWSQIAPANNQQPGAFSPFSTGAGGQGQWNNIISVQKDNPKRIILGGIDLYSWSTTGNWTQLSQWFLPQQSPQYVHADNHDLFWDQEGRLYIANDGGIAVSDNNGLSFYPANRGFNVAQFYAIGASAHGDVIGGTQDNGTLVNYHDNTTWHEFDQTLGGDGFSADISFINRDIVFSTLYYGGLFRSVDRGQNNSLFVPEEFSTVGIGNIGCNPGSTGGDGCGQFFTNVKLWEDPSDVNSTDIVTFVPSQAYSAGETVLVPSQTNQTFIEYTTPTDVIFDDTVIFNPAITGEDTIITSIAPSSDYNLSILDYQFVSGNHPIVSGDSLYLVDLDTTIEILSYVTIPHYYATNNLSPGDTLDMGNDSILFEIAWDTLQVQDPYQSWMAIGLGGGDGVWLTRNALRFSSPSNEWFRVNHFNIGEVSTMEFSRDGNHLFIGTWSGQLYRLSGIGDIYSPEKGIDTLMDVTNVSDVNDLQTTWTAIHSGSGFGAPVTGIGVESDVDHVVITLGNYAGTNKVRESWNASGASPAWTSISGNLPNSPFGGSLPVYAVVIDREDPSTILIGTDQGAFITTDGGTIWENCSGSFGPTPIFDMVQNWRSWDEGCFRPGEIYIGTHGRGIWASDNFLNITDQIQTEIIEEFNPEIELFPNPAIDQINISFEQQNSTIANIRIYNLSGKLLLNNENIQSTEGKNQLTIDVSNIPKGTYILNLQSGNDSRSTKFIK